MLHLQLFSVLLIFFFLSGNRAQRVQKTSRTFSYPSIVSILRRRPVVQELIPRGAQIEAHVDNVCLVTNTQEGHLTILGKFFAVCQENHNRLKLEKCEFMQETMQYLGFDIGYRWWTPAASKA